MRLRSLTLISVSLLTLAACTMSVKQTTNKVRISPYLVKNQGSDKYQQAETAFQLEMENASPKVLPVLSVNGDTPVEINIINPQMYKGTNVVRAYETYLGGGGFQVALRKLSSKEISVLTRDTSEGNDEEKGGCGPWSEVGRITFESNAQVEFNDSALKTLDTMIIQCTF